MTEEAFQGVASDWWELSEKESGEISEGSAWGIWIQPYWVIVALKCAMSKPRIDLSIVRLLNGVSEYDCQTLHKRLDFILQNDHKWFTAEENIRKGEKFLLGIFGAIAQRQRKIDCQKIISDNISQATIEKFKARCNDGYKNEIKLRNLLAKYEKTFQKNISDKVATLREYLHYIDKDDLTSESRDTGLARICGEAVGRRESLCYSGAIEDRLFTKGQISSFQDLEAKIKNEALFLRKKGYNPQIVFIPWDFRYKKSLTNEPDWKRKCPLPGGPFPRWATSIDGMEIFVWPHQDSNCVGIIDIGALARFKEKDGMNGESLKISFRNLNKEELHQLLFGEIKQRGIREFKKWLRTFEYDLNKIAEMRRIVVIKNMMVLELLDINAGVKILPVDEKMGIVYRDGERIYHLPECELVQTMLPIERRFFHTIGIAKLKNDEGFKPCPKCHPNFER